MDDVCENMSGNISPLSAAGHCAATVFKDLKMVRSVVWFSKTMTR